MTRTVSLMLRTIAQRPEALSARASSGIGSDRHVSIGVAQELRLPGYAQRTTARATVGGLRTRNSCLHGAKAARQGRCRRLHNALWTRFALARAVHLRQPGDDVPGFQAAIACGRRHATAGCGRASCQPAGYSGGNGIAVERGNGGVLEVGVDWLALVRRMAVDPDFARYKVVRAVGFARAAGLFHGCETGRRVCATGFVRVRNAGRLHIGDRVTFLGGMLASQLVCRPGATIAIGDETTFNYGVSLEASTSIRIGRRCMVASMVRICDTHVGQSLPVTIGDDVWIAHGAIIGPGVSIGSGSVVSAGSVVHKNVPPGFMAIGNPARCMALEVVA